MAKSFLMDLYKKASMNVASKNLLKTDLLYNKVLLYIVFIVSLINLLIWVVAGDTINIVIFLLVGFLTSFFSKNMIVILLFALVISNIVKYGTEVGEEGFDVKEGEKEGMEEDFEEGVNEGMEEDFEEGVNEGMEEDFEEGEKKEGLEEDFEEGEKKEGLEEGVDAEITNNVVDPKKTNKVVNNSEGMAPKKEGMAPKKEGMAPKKEGMAPKKEGMAPKKEGMAPKKEGMAPKKEGMAPKKEGMAPKKEGMEPKKEGMQTLAYSFTDATYSFPDMIQQQNTLLSNVSALNPYLVMADNESKLRSQIKYSEFTKQ
jgi:uncharacterized membrane protein YphA (DoxX/SURF4 family)